MKDKLYCPFCGEELDGDDILVCKNYKCDTAARMSGSRKLWQALIDNKKENSELDAEYDEFICSTWVDYADEPDEKLTSDAQKLRDRMRRIMNGQILKERDKYKKITHELMETLSIVDSALSEIMLNKKETNYEKASLIADTTLNKVLDNLESIKKELNEE